MKTETKLIGLELSAVGLEPGQTRTLKEMASWCDSVAEVTGDKKQAISWQRLHQIQERALRKCRIRLCAEVPHEIREAAMAIIFPSDRRPAQKFSSTSGARIGRFLLGDNKTNQTI